MNRRVLQRLIRKKKWLLLVLLAATWLLRENINGWPWSDRVVPANNDGAITAPASWQDGRMVRVQGTVLKVLKTDNQGSRHQRWLMQVPGREQTLLVAHNIDLAPVVPLQAGDTLEVYGEFENNAKGGLLHWTHADPAGRHADGWIRHKNRLYH